MDYEFCILALEKELAHAREMQSIHRAHDASLGVVGSRMDRIEANLEAASELLKTLAVKFDDLVEILAREHANGKKG